MLSFLLEFRSNSVGAIDIIVAVVTHTFTPCLSYVGVYQEELPCFKFIVVVATAATATSWYKIVVAEGVQRKGVDNVIVAQ